MRKTIILLLAAAALPATAFADTCPAPAAQPLQPTAVVPVANELAPLAVGQLGAPNGVLAQAYDQVLTLDPEQRYMLLAPVVRERKGEHAQIFEQLRAQGYVRVRVDGALQHHFPQVRREDAQHHEEVGVSCRRRDEQLDRRWTPDLGFTLQRSGEEGHSLGLSFEADA